MAKLDSKAGSLSLSRNIVSSLAGVQSGFRFLCAQTRCSAQWELDGWTGGQAELTHSRQASPEVACVPALEGDPENAGLCWSWLPQLLPCRWCVLEDSLQCRQNFLYLLVSTDRCLFSSPPPKYGGVQKLHKDNAHKARSYLGHLRFHISRTEQLACFSEGYTWEDCICFSIF